MLSVIFWSYKKKIQHASELAYFMFSERVSKRPTQPPFQKADAVPIPERQRFINAAFWLGG